MMLNFVDFDVVQFIFVLLVIIIIIIIFYTFL